MRTRNFLLLIVALSLLVCGCGIKKSIVKRPMDTPVIMVAPINPKISNEQIRQVIISACSRYGWAVNEATASNVEATLNHQGKETVTVDIPYSRDRVEIKYKSSTNMHFDGNKIHRSYNRWVKNLEVEIRNGIASAR